MYKFKINILVLTILLAATIIGCSKGGRDKVDLVPAYSPDSNAELKPVKLPEISEKVLDNGLKIIAVVHDELPVIAMQMMIKTGSTADPVNEAGLAVFTAQLLTKGTKSRSAIEIAEQIDFIGGSLNSDANWDRSTISCRSLVKHFDTALDLFADVCLNPIFQDSEVERLRTRKISSYVSDLDDPSTLASIYFARSLYPDHRFGKPQDGDDSTLKNIARQRIMDFYHDYYAPNNSVLVISGDIDPEQYFQKLEDKFGDWKSKDIKEGTLPTTDPIQGYKILMVNKTDATQSQIRIGHYGVARDNEDFFSILLMNYILGEGASSSRLTKKVRAEMGLTYSIRSTFEFNKNPGPFMISTFTKNENVELAISEIIGIVKEFKLSEATPEELSDAQSFRTGTYPMRFETPSLIASQLLYVELYNLGDDYIEKYRDNIQKVTLENSLDAAQKYLDPDNMVIVVVGPKDELYDQLTKFGKVEVQEIDG